MQPGNTSGIITDEEIVRARTTGDNGGENAVAADDKDPVNTANNSSREKVAATARRLIEEWKRPVKRSELCEQLRKQGLVIEGPDPEMVITSILWRAGDAAGIVRLTRGDGYWLKEMPWQPSGYDPADEKTATVRRALAQHFDEPDVADDGSDTLAKYYSWRGIIAAVCRGLE